MGSQTDILRPRCRPRPPSRTELPSPHDRYAPAAQHNKHYKSKYCQHKKRVYQKYNIRKYPPKKIKECQDLLEINLKERIFFSSIHTGKELSKRYSIIYKIGEIKMICIAKTYMSMLVEII